MAPPQQSRSLISGFFRSLLANPANPALELGELSLSYEQLWNYAGRITACLKDNLDRSESVVAVLADRSVGAYGGILGVLGSGRGYVPLNPRFPLDRTLQDSGGRSRVRGCAGILASALGQTADADHPRFRVGTGQQGSSISPGRPGKTVVEDRRPARTKGRRKRYGVSAVYFRQHRGAERSRRQPIECCCLHGVRCQALWDSWRRSLFTKL